MSLSWEIKKKKKTINLNLNFSKQLALFTVCLFNFFFICITSIYNIRMVYITSTKKGEEIFPSKGFYQYR